MLLLALEQRIPCTFSKVRHIYSLTIEMILPHKLGTKVQFAIHAIKCRKYISYSIHLKEMKCKY